MSRICRSRSRRWCGRASRGRRPGVERRPGRVFVLRADLIVGRDARRCCQRSRASCWSAQRGQPGRAARPCSQRPRAGRPQPRSRRRPHAQPAPPPATPRARILQRPRRLRGRRPRICDDPRPGPVDAGALDQRHRQSGVRLSGRGRRRRLSPGRSTAARTSSRPGRTIRSAIARARCSICATRRPASCGARRRCRSATKRATYVARHGQGYSRFEHTAHGIALELLQFVPLDDPIKISRLRLRNTSDRAAASLGHRLCRMGARPVAQRRRRRSSTTEIDAATGAMFARNPWNAAFRHRASPSPTCGGAQTELDRRPPRVPRPQRHAGAARRRSQARRRSRKTRRRRARSLRRAADHGRAARRTAAPRSCSCSGEAADADEARAPDRALSRAPISTPSLAEVGALLGRRARRGPGEDARPLDGHHAEPLAALSDAGLPRLGALGVLSGQRRLWLSRSAAGRHGARRRRGRR